MKSLKEEAEMQTIRCTTSMAFAALATIALVAPGVFAATPQDDSAPAAAAQSDNVPLAGGASNPPTFEQADANNNGVLEPNEVYRVGVAFPMLDRDHNGMVTRVEYMSSTALYAGSETQGDTSQTADINSEAKADSQASR